MFQVSSSNDDDDEDDDEADQLKEESAKSMENIAETVSDDQDDDSDEEEKESIASKIKEQLAKPIEKVRTIAEAVGDQIRNQVNLLVDNQIVKFLFSSLLLLIRKMMVKTQVMIQMKKMTMNLRNYLRRLEIHWLNQMKQPLLLLQILPRHLLQVMKKMMMIPMRNQYQLLKKLNNV